MRSCIILLFASLALSSSASGAKSSAAKVVGVIGNHCSQLGSVSLCRNPDPKADVVLLLVAGRRTHILLEDDDVPPPYEIERHQNRYRVKVGARSRSDVPFFAYTEVEFRQTVRGFRVERYTIATDSTCEGSPDIRMLYKFDLQKRTQTAILASPWSSDGRVHRFVSPAKLPSNDLFHLDAVHFVYRLRSVAAIQRFCSA